MRQAKRSGSEDQAACPPLGAPTAARRPHLAEELCRDTDRALLPSMITMLSAQSGSEHRIVRAEMHDVPQPDEQVVGWHHPREPSEAVAVAEKVTVGMPLTDAAMELAPAEGPRIQAVDARPPAVVDWVVKPTDPPPAVTANATGIPGTPLPYWSATRTTGAVLTAVAAAPD